MMTISWMNQNVESTYYVFVGLFCTNLIHCIYIMSRLDWLFIFNQMYNLNILIWELGGKLISKRKRKIKWIHSGASIEPFLLSMLKEKERVTNCSLYLYLFCCLFVYMLLGSCNNTRLKLVLVFGLFCNRPSCISYIFTGPNH